MAHHRVMGGYTYMMTNMRNGTLYTGVAAKVGQRAWEHKEGRGSRFCRKYGLNMLVWYEFHDRIEAAIQRETSIKRWPRRWKLALIERMNPEWRDLSLAWID